MYWGFLGGFEGLDDLIIRIGRMIAYQEYNTKSPLNGLAAKWAEQHAQLFPGRSAGYCAAAGKKLRRLQNWSPIPAAPLEQAPGKTSDDAETLAVTTSEVPQASSANPEAPPDRWPERISTE